MRRAPSRASSSNVWLTIAAGCSSGALGSGSAADSTTGAIAWRSSPAFVGGWGWATGGQGVVRFHERRLLLWLERPRKGTPFLFALAGWPGANFHTS